MKFLKPKALFILFALMALAAIAAPIAYNINGPTPDGNDQCIPPE